MSDFLQLDQALLRRVAPLRAALEAAGFYAIFFHPEYMPDRPVLTRVDIIAHLRVAGGKARVDVGISDALLDDPEAYSAVVDGMLRTALRAAGLG